MKVWWCEEHDARESLGHYVRFYRTNRRYCDDRSSDSPCRIVEMQLVPADARMVVLRVAESVRWCAEHRSSADLSDDDPSICLLAGYVDPHWQTPCRWVVAFVSDSTKTEPPKDPWDYDP